ncbi:cation:proton antiporter [Clostridium aestuarii]|uniref:Cation:proton antiporter n=1 Tax=Clostridium aestuarii TaxID=338193 RepID=A0ABT4CV58_9CLOT|nr:cation:proton antiporter [Clostridium aestuarii]MCY6482865.1 cation:proton antiporter [Clostridium aestuarii]
MLSIHFLLDLAIILLSTKVLGLLTRKFRMPQVVGALLAGLIFGPSLLNIVHETDFITRMAELGVIVLMFQAGLESDFKELKKCGKASFLIALIGVLVPLLGGFLAASIFNSSGSSFINIYSKAFLENVFIGIVLTATSVSITVETLQELGKLKSTSGTAIMGAAIIDDILGIVLLTIVTSTTDSSVHLGIIFMKILAFFVLAVIVGIGFSYLFEKLSEDCGRKRRIPLIAFSFCLVFAYVSEYCFGVADITGAFIAGVVISNTCQSKYVQRRIEIMSYMLLSPIFFANVGINTSISGMNSKMIIFTIVLLVIAIVTKIIGCGLGARLCGYTNEDSIRIGVGMVSRGEVALIIANKGAALGLLSSVYFAPIVLVVIVTTLITPILLKIVYVNDNKKINKIT